LTLTLNSYTKWDTVRGEAQITFYGPKGEKQIFVDKFDIAQPNKANIESISLNGVGQDTIWISDGGLSYSLDEASKTYTSMKLPSFINDYSRLPKTLSEITADTVYNHPFALVIPFPIREYIYSEWFSQGGGKYSLLGEENILGRSTWAIEHQKGTDIVKAWVDQQTGVILKYSQESNENPFLDVEITKIEFNTPIANGIFLLASEYKPVINH
jgi:outer membrane lipoprotein-sorting protein